ncbi:srg family chemoreceptor domain-containing protein [Ditylenchus destructor]|uniref:Serpentine receptor class gamma n=1 Tax=Ditylenchus destructor TaxID=166010 RepID=A0AAD4QS77_9BILA|nr:srg family chemoreceptor domain-containing protein [Ditylenchus destructor]
MSRNRFLEVGPEPVPIVFPDRDEPMKTKIAQNGVATDYMTQAPIQLLILFVFDVPAFVFHLSMLIFILSQIITKNAYYRQGFYVLYCAVSLVDLYYVAITYALFRVGYLFGLFVDRYRCWDLGAKWVFESTDYCAWFQACAHTTIAFNRFTVFYLKQSHNTIWSRKWMVIIIIALFISPVFGMTTSFGAPVTYIFNADELIVVAYYDTNMSQVTRIVGFCYYFPLTIIGSTLNICSLVRYRRYMRENAISSGQVNQDHMLLIHTIFMLIAQILRTIYYVTLVVGLFVLPGNVSSNFLGFMQANIFLFSDAYSLLGSVFLFTLSSTVRKDFLLFYGCRPKKECFTRVSKMQTGF